MAGSPHHHVGTDGMCNSSPSRPTSSPAVGPSRWPGAKTSATDSTGGPTVRAGDPRTLNTLEDPERTAFTIALGNSPELEAWPYRAGVSSPG